MALDPYQLCPCGSGKKLKFCCHELSADIEKIHRQLAGDQPHAALRHVDATLAKHPKRVPLLDLKAIIELSLGNVDLAQQAIATILEQEPYSPTGNALQALVHAARSEPREAVDRLQTALEAFDHEVPQRVYEAVGAVAHSLLSTGEILAARGHLFIYHRMSNGQDSRGLDLLVRMNRMTGLPLPLRERRPLRLLPADHPAADVMASICVQAAIGNWRKAAATCDEVLPDHLDTPLFFYNRALLSGYLGDTKNMVAGLRLYARQNVPHDDAVEAEAVARLLDESIRETPIMANKVTFTVTDEDACYEALCDNRLTVFYQMDHEEFGDGPRPRGMFLLLDREQPTLCDDLAPSEIPVIVGIASLYGRQTDRPARLELTTDNDDQFDATIASIATIGGNAVADGPVIEEAGESASDDPVLSWRWHFPEKMSPSRRRALSAIERRRRLLEVWPDHPRVTLDGKTPREAANDPSTRLLVEADVFVLEQSLKSPEDLESFNRLREELDLPIPGTIDATNLELSEFPVSRIHRLDFSTLDDDQIVRLFHQAAAIGAVAAIRHAGRELLARKSDSLIADVFEHMFSVEDNAEPALQVLEQAREWSLKNNYSCGRWDMLELQFHIFEQDSAGASRVMNHLQVEHRNEPEVMEQLYQLMVMLGLIETSDSALGSSDDLEFDDYASPPPSGSEIWTPTAVDGGGPSQKLWLPG